MATKKISAALIAIVAISLAHAGPSEVHAHFSSLAVVPSPIILGESADLSFNLSKSMKVPEGILHCRAELTEVNLTVDVPPQLLVLNLTVETEPREVRVYASGRRVRLRHDGDILSATLRAVVVAPLNSSPGIYPVRVVALGKEVLPNGSIRYLNATQKVSLTVGAWHPAAEVGVSPSRITPPGRVAVRVDVGNPSSLWVARPGGGVERVNITVENAIIVVSAPFLKGQDTIPVGEVGPGRVEVINRVYDLPEDVSAGINRIVAVVSGSAGSAAGSVVVKSDLEVVKQADVRIESVNVPGEVSENSTFPVNVTIKNYSPFPARSVRLSVSAGGQEEGVELGDLEGYGQRSAVVALPSGPLGNLSVSISVFWRDPYPSQTRQVESEVTLRVLPREGGGGLPSLPINLILAAGALALGLVVGYAWRRPKSDKR